LKDGAQFGTHAGMFCYDQNPDAAGHETSPFLY
jgi:hypothetical protein